MVFTVPTSPQAIFLIVVGMARHSFVGVDMLDACLGSLCCRRMIRVIYNDLQISRGSLEVERGGFYLSC
jgi:hypothetical protein